MKSTKSINSYSTSDVLAMTERERLHLEIELFTAHSWGFDGVELADGTIIEQL